MERTVSAQAIYHSFPAEQLIKTNTFSTDSRFIWSKTGKQNYMKIATLRSTLKFSIHKNRIVDNSKMNVRTRRVNTFSRLKFSDVQANHKAKMFPAAESLACFRPRTRRLVPSIIMRPTHDSGEIQIFVKIKR